MTTKGGNESSVVDSIDNVKPIESALFSAATFFDIISSDIGTGPTHNLALNLPKPAIVAFYGFRGGAGRTLALAHVATALARRGLAIAGVDLDLEAPGLHSVFGVEPGPATGALYLLRDAFLASPEQREHLDAAPHVVRVPDVEDLWVVPAGAINQRYLATLEELNVSLWHLDATTHPLRTLAAALQRALPRLDAVLVDCRTGFHPMAATTLFHASDAIVLCTTLSPQIWEGLRVFLDALKVARTRRDGAPALLVLPSMVPPGEVGDQLVRAFVDRFRGEHDERVTRAPDAELATLEDPTKQLWELDAVRYDADIAARGTVDLRRDSRFGPYRSLEESIARAAGADLDELAGSRAANLDVRRVLDELVIPRSHAFAEEIPNESVEDLFVKSSRHARIEDRQTTLIVGAKGAGKSLFWRWLIRQPPGERRFIPGHAPVRASNEGGPLNLSPDALKELERSAAMTKHGTHKAFWGLYAVARIKALEPDVNCVPADANGEERKVLRQLFKATNSSLLLTALVRVLELESAGTLAERCLAQADASLLENRRLAVTLVYDGLDDGFDVGVDAESMRQRYVTALLQLLGDVRGRHLRLSFKVFLREDVWESVTPQNRSHLDAARVDLKWEPRDLWTMAARLLQSSETYRQAVPLPSPNATVADLERALEPLWGRHIEGNQTTRTANYVKNRMADGVGRFFPRTLVQMLGKAIEEERSKIDPLPGRVIRLRSLQRGIESASKQRVTDLQSEYKALAPYLGLFTGEQPTGTRDEIRNRLQRRFVAEARRTKPGVKKSRGVVAGALHAGAGGWMKVVQLLETVGVLGRYRAAADNVLQVALLYRPGLGIPLYGG